MPHPTIDDPQIDSFGDTIRRERMPQDVPASNVGPFLPSRRCVARRLAKDDLPANQIKQNGLKGKLAHIGKAFGGVLSVLAGRS